MINLVAYATSFKISVLVVDGKKNGYKYFWNEVGLRHLEHEHWFFNWALVIPLCATTTPSKLLCLLVNGWGVVFTAIGAMLGTGILMGLLVTDRFTKKILITSICIISGKFVM